VIWDLHQVRRGPDQQQERAPHQQLVRGHHPC
jgi:hypothetical protein